MNFYLKFITLKLALTSVKLGCAIMKRLKAASLLVTLIIETFMFFNSFAPTVNATYIHEDIKQDTIWTLMDSPYIIINDITIYPNVTLTIEPGVEIRFGGNFSLTVNGTLIVNGESNRMVKFTSNTEMPQAGDWNAIRFYNSQNSKLSYCVVEYAIDGIFVKNSSLEILGCKIYENLKNGINIAENCNLSIKNSIIMSNENGIFSDIDSEVTIENTTITYNDHGIHLEGSIQNFQIINNTLSSNEIGIYISDQVNSRISNNSIAYNEIGVLFENASYSVPINFNDIYGNDLAMNAVESDPVNATYNYWGDESGPYHPSLNPSGKGNPVESNGTDLIFIPFLSASNHYVNKRPIARLLTDKILVAPNQTVWFIATNSSDERRIDYFMFDFGDGEKSGWTSLSLFAHKYASIGNYTARLWVMDDFGAVSSNTPQVTINVQNLPTLSVTLTLTNNVVGRNKKVTITVQVKSDGSPVQNAYVKLFSLKEGYFENSTGYTDANGYLTTTFVTPNITQSTTIMLVATASKDGFADGSDHEYLEVVPPLSVEVNAYPQTIRSEETATIEVYVTYDEQPIVSALVEPFSNAGGSFNPEIGFTDQEGKCVFNFTAPKTLTKLNVTISVTASKTGYETGGNEVIVAVEPKVLNIEVTAEPYTIKSESTSNITVYVTCEEIPVSNVNVSVYASIGNFSASNNLTNLNGIAQFTFVSPPVSEQENITITVIAEKDGYVGAEENVTIMVEPKTLKLDVVVEPSIIESGQTATVMIYVESDSAAIANVSIMLTSYYGNFSQNSGATDKDGCFTVMFYAPEVTTETNVSIVVTAEKIGYSEAQATTVLTVIPPQAAQGGGALLPPVFLMVIIGVLAVIVIIALLIRFKVIEIGVEEESEEQTS